jgi:hypothetical protein
VARTLLYPLSYAPVNRGEPRWTFPNDLGSLRLLSRVLMHVEEFTSDAFFTLAEAIDLATPT